MSGVNLGKAVTIPARLSLAASGVVIPEGPPGPVGPVGPEGPEGPPGSPTAYEIRGVGQPNGAVTAAPGAYYTDTAGTTGAWRWVKTAGTGNTGWAVQHGDMGVRNISASLDPVWTVLTASLRRVGASVSLNLAIRSASSTGTLNIYSLPVGFRPPASVTSAAPLTASTSATAGVITAVNGSGLVRSFGTAASSAWCYASMTWVTDDAWPTSLPGTAA